MSKGIIVHIADVRINAVSGMGRIEHFWKVAFESQGYEFVHIGPDEVGKMFHKSIFSFKAYSYFKKLKIKPLAFIIHEPAALSFVKKNIPVFLESHGIERRFWEYKLQENDSKGMSLMTKITFPIWRLLQCDIGLKKANRLLLTNREDESYAIKKYNRNPKDIYVFENGINQIDSSQVPDKFTVLFNGSWIIRKGILTLIEAAKILHKKGLEISYLLTGTSNSEQEVLADWPPNLQKQVTVISRFKAEEEQNILKSASVVVLPSIFEGQPLSIVQAMGAGKCCITTNCCGQKDVIKNEINGLLFERQDFTAFAKLIEDCYHNPLLISTIGNAAKMSMRNRTWKAVSDGVVSFVLSNV